MSTAEQSAQVIRKIYETFGPGDVLGVLARVDENATWANQYGQGRFPGQWGIPCRGHAKSMGFFRGEARPEADPGPLFNGLPVESRAPKVARQDARTEMMPGPILKETSSWQPEQLLLRQWNPYWTRQL